MGLLREAGMVGDDGSDYKEKKPMVQNSKTGFLLSFLERAAAADKMVF